MGFIALSVLFTVTVSAGNLTFLENSIDNPVDKVHSVQAKSSFGMYLLIDSEAESVVSVSQPDTLPLSYDEDSPKTNGLQFRSHKLSLIQGSKSQNYDYIFLNNSFSKDIIFPFHSFW